MPRRGFTLIEVMVGITVSSMVLVGVAATVIAINGAYQNHNSTKQASESGRVSLGYMERTLRMAGYGLNPRFAFDFGTTDLPGLTKDNYSEVLPQWGTYATDDLAFRYRDPYYLRRGTVASVAGGPPFNFNLENPSTLGRAFQVGEVVMVACVGSQESFLGKVMTAAPSTGTTLQLIPRGGSGLPTEPPSCSQSGTGEGAPFLMLVQEKRLRVVSLGGRPHLVVFHDWNVPLTDNFNYDPIAANVEAFQVSYVMNRPPFGSPHVATTPVDNTTNQNWILGDAEGGDLLPRPGDSAPTLDTHYDDPLRYTGHPANIRGVRISLAVRSATANSSRQVQLPVRLANHTVPGSAERFTRVVVETLVQVPNMTARAFFTPALRSPLNPADRRNAWGG
jgi:type IV pilus assembly protein PilW